MVVSAKVKVNAQSPSLKVSRVDLRSMNAFNANIHAFIQADLTWSELRLVKVTIAVIFGSRTEASLPQSISVEIYLVVCRFPMY